MSGGLQRAIAEALDSARWQLIILPTEQCNFRCTYCYESFKHRTMRQATVQAVKRLVARRFDEIDALDIQWFGGEPLLARKCIRSIAGWIAAEKPDRVRYTSGMTTNGLLLDADCLAEMTSLGICSYQITLDGWSEGHDRTRIRRGGGPTFDTIWANLIAARDSNFDFAITLRVHFCPSNVESVRRLLDEINATFGADARFRVFLKAVGHYGGPNDGVFRVFAPDEERTIRRELEATLRMARRPLSIDPARPYVCYALKPNSLVIRSTGRIAKCTVAFDDESNDVGVLEDNGELRFHDERLANWFVGLQTMRRKDLSCPWSRIRRI